MKNKIFILAASLCMLFFDNNVVFASIASSQGRFLLCKMTVSRMMDRNKRKVDSLKLGVTKKEVEVIFGHKTIIAHQLGESIEINNPQKEEEIKIKRNDKEIKVDILYYVTENTGSDYRIKNESLTPLVFENNILVGIGWDALSEVKKEQVK